MVHVAAGHSLGASPRSELLHADRADSGGAEIPGHAGHVRIRRRVPAGGLLFRREGEVEVEEQIDRTRGRAVRFRRGRCHVWRE